MASKDSESADGQAHLVSAFTVYLSDNLTSTPFIWTCSFDYYRYIDLAVCAVGEFLSLIFVRIKTNISSKVKFEPV